MTPGPYHCNLYIFHLIDRVCSYHPTWQKRSRSSRLGWGRNFISSRDFPWLHALVLPYWVIYHSNIYKTRLQIGWLLRQHFSKTSSNLILSTSLTLINIQARPVTNRNGSGMLLNRTFIRSRGSDLSVLMAEPDKVCLNPCPHSFAWV